MQSKKLMVMIILVLWWFRSEDRF